MSNRGDVSVEALLLRRLLQLALSMQSVSLPGALMLEQQRIARAVYFLLDVEPEHDAETFIVLELERLLRQLNRRTEQQQVEVQGQVRGRVAWQATYKARYTQGCDPGRFVCREVHRQYDTPENQLLRYMVECINECLAVVPEVLRAGLAYLPAPADRTSHPIALGERLSRMERVLSMQRFNARLRDVTLPMRVEDLHVLRAEGARTQGYVRLAQLYRRYQAIVLQPSWEGMLAAGRRVLLLPARADAQGDPWLRLGAALLRGS